MGLLGAYETLINFACLSPLLALHGFGNFLNDLGTIAYFATSTVTDTTAALLTLGTKTIGLAVNLGMLVGLAAAFIVIAPLYAGFAILKGIFSLASSGKELDKKENNFVGAPNP